MLDMSYKNISLHELNERFDNIFPFLSDIPQLSELKSNICMLSTPRWAPVQRQCPCWQWQLLDLFVNQSLRTEKSKVLDPFG